MPPDRREPEFFGLTDFDSFFYELELRLGTGGFDAIASVAKEIGLVNAGAAEVVDLRKREDGRYNLFHKLPNGARVVIVLAEQPNGKFKAEEGGYLKG